MPPVIFLTVLVLQREMIEVSLSLTIMSILPKSKISKVVVSEFL